MIIKNSKKTKNSGKYNIIYGLHSVKAALLNEKREHEELLININHSKLAEKYRSKIKKISFLDQKDFKRLYGDEKSTQGIVLKTKDFQRPTLEQFIHDQKSEDKSILLALDQITDPQNIGSIMRSCALFNCKGIIVAKDNTPDLTPSIFKAASGAAEIVNYFKVTNLKRSISNLKKYGYWIYGFDSADNKKNTKISFSKKSVLVFGSEGKGMRDLVKKECDELIKINMQPNEKFQIDSLNVSNATTIGLYEFYKS
jgi:23S rRNA (guanosine2251-2'-O)-methyltransferase